MQEIAGINLRVAMDIAIHHGLPAETLLAGLGITERELREGRRRRYDWDTYAEMLDRVAAHRGGVEHMPTIGEGVPGAFPDPLRNEVLAAARAGGAAGFDVAPAGADQSLVLLHGPGEEVERRLASAAERWTLTGRQLDVLRALVEGLSNQEIAERLECTARTVEVHVTGLLDKAGSASRLQVVAAFWSDL